MSALDWSSWAALPELPFVVGAFGDVVGPFGDVVGPLKIRRSRVARFRRVGIKRGAEKKANNGQMYNIWARCSVAT